MITVAILIIPICAFLLGFAVGAIAVIHRLDKLMEEVEDNG